MLPSVSTQMLQADPAGLAGLRARAASDPDAALMDVARQFEAVLTQQMLSAMRATSFGDDGAGKHGATYRSMMDGQLAQSLAESGRGLGIAQQLVAQLRGASAPIDGIKSGAPAADTADMHLSAERIQAQRPVATAPTFGVAPPAGDLSTSISDFVARVRPHAERAAEALGVPLRAVLAHAALESGWGRHAPGDNYFGIKADARWQGPAGSRATEEFIDGRLQPRVERFRDYGGAAAAFGDYARFLQDNPRYRQALMASDGPGFLRAVADAGYATDPDYADKLQRVYHSPLLDAALRDAGPAAPAVTTEQTL